MNKTVIEVPAEIKYISDWSEREDGYKLENFQFPHILDKKITGCGYTEYCLRNPLNVVICSPRRVLLENKVDQHAGDFRVFYFNNNTTSINYDKDLSSSSNSKKKQKQHTELKENVEYFKLKNPAAFVSTDTVFDEYPMDRETESKPEEPDKLKDLKQALRNRVDSVFNGCKILVTYDSFRHVKEVLTQMGVIDQFFIVIDEFQSLLVDSRFKSDTEIELLYQLKDIQKLCFVSATPMMEEFLEMLDFFKDLPYFEFDWSSLQPGRVLKPEIELKCCRRLNKEINTVIKSYLEGDFVSSAYLNSEGKVVEVVSKEAVIYVNSVKNITNIIINNKLTPENTNVLCSRTSDNSKKISEAFKISCGEGGDIGTVPKRGEPHKMFTLCTRTVYLGADFYSTNARSFIFSDANYECLSVDITLDLPQILGRQRLDENPWKNRAEIFYIPIKEKNKVAERDFEAYIKEKEADTINCLNAFNNATPEELKSLLKIYANIVKEDDYKNSYLSINKHAGYGLKPEFNHLVLISELRTYKIQQLDYRDRVSVFNTTNEKFNVEDNLIDSMIREFYSLSTFVDKMYFVCNTGLNSDSLSVFLKQIPTVFGSYYYVVGPEKIKALCYRNDFIKPEYNKIMSSNNDSLINEIKEYFKVGARYSKSEIKSVLTSIYGKYNNTQAIKATDLGNYFEIKECNLFNKETGKYDKGFEVLKEL